MPAEFEKNGFGNVFWEEFSYSVFWEEFEKNSYPFFFKYLVETTSEAVWFQTFVC